MDEKDKIEKEKKDRSTDQKCTGGDLPEAQEQFEGTTWVQEADHGVSSTEAERKNVSKTLPDSAAKEKDSKRK